MYPLDCIFIYVLKLTEPEISILTFENRNKTFIIAGLKLSNKIQIFKFETVFANLCLSFNYNNLFNCFGCKSSGLIPTSNDFLY